MRLAAIDIGSNAARLLIVEVQHSSGKVNFDKLNLIRIPLRLGFDVFANGKIGENKRQMLLHMMQAFKSLIDLYHVDAMRAYATSAMRNAKNSERIIKQVKKQTGIKIRVISGIKESDLLFQIHAAEKLNKKKTYLYVNVGGGSTELNLYAKGKSIKETSIEIGTIRLLKNKVKDKQWEEFRRTIRDFCKKHKPDAVIGTGGNINKVASLKRLKPDEALKFKAMQHLYHQLHQLTTAQRRNKYALNADRADVIVPALQIYLEVMKQSKVSDMYVPKAGLVDGIIYDLYGQLKHKYRI